MTNPDLPELPPNAFSKQDRSADALFYRAPRFVAHIDAGAIAAVTALYRATLPQGGAILDLMSSWISHLPEGALYAEVAGLGMNAAELSANPRLNERVVQDLNENPTLPFASERFDAALICVSIQYLERPVAVLREAARVLEPGAPVIVTFSNRCFPTKAVAIWRALDGAGQTRLVSLCIARAGFVDVETKTLIPEGGGPDPVWAVVGRAPAP